MAVYSEDNNQHSDGSNSEVHLPESIKGSYTVRWEIVIDKDQLEDPESFMEAADEAEKMRLHGELFIYNVTNNTTGEVKTVDLQTGDISL